MTKRYAVIGLGRFGASLAQELAEAGQYVLAVDVDADRVDELAQVLPRVVRADCTDPAVLRALRIPEFDTVVVAIGDNVESSVITVLNCRELGVPYLVAQAQDEAHGRILKQLGVDRVVYPQRDMGIRVAHNIATGGIIDYVRLSDEYGLAEITPPRTVLGKSLRELDLPHRFGLNVMAIKRG
ncbi:MAG: potassium uptake system protein, partial [Symbiobacterium thermophilum]